MKNLTMHQKLWAFAGVCAAIALAACYLFYTDEFQAYQAGAQRLDAEIGKRRSELRQILAQKQRLTDLEAEIEVANQEFARLQEMFPDQEVLPRRLIDLTTVTRKSLTLPTKFLPLPGEEKEFYRENHYSVTLSSSYHGLGMLFGEIANFRYPTTIRRMSIDRVGDLDKVVEESRDHGEIPKTLVASFQLTTFTSKR